MIVPTEIPVTREVPVEVTREVPVEVTRVVEQTVIVPTEIPVTREVPVEVTRIVEQTVIVPQEVEVTKVVVATPRLTCDRVNKLYDQFQEDIVAEYESRWPVSANEEAEILNRVFGLVYAIRFLFPDCVRGGA